MGGLSAVVAVLSHRGKVDNTCGSNLVLLESGNELTQLALILGLMLGSGLVALCRETR